MKSYEILPPGMTGSAMGGAKVPKSYEILPGAGTAEQGLVGWTKGASAIASSVPAHGASGNQTFGLPYDPAGKAPTYGVAAVPRMGKQPKSYEIPPSPYVANRGQGKVGGCEGKCQGETRHGVSFDDSTSFKYRAPSPLEIPPGIPVSKFIPPPAQAQEVEIQWGAHIRMPPPLMDDMAAHVFFCGEVRGRVDYLLRRLTEIQNTQRQISEEMAWLRTMNPAALHAAACQAILDQAGALSIVINRAIDDEDRRTVDALQPVHQGLVKRARACVMEPYTVSGPEATNLAAERVRTLRSMWETQRLLLLSAYTELGQSIQALSDNHC